MHGIMTRSKREPPSTNGRAANKNPLLFEYESPSKEGAARRGAITFFNDDYELLKPPKFLNDTIVSFFMQYHWDTAVADEVKKRTHVFNSFFFSKLVAIKKKEKKQDVVSYDAISRWLKGVRIFDKDFLIMPICDRDHWLLAVICYPESRFSNRASTVPDEELREPAVIILNSFFGHAPSVKRTLNRFLSHRWHIERGELRKFPIEMAKGRGTRLLFPDLPQQKNSYNCGVYMLNFFYCFLKDPRKYYIRMFRRKDMTNWFSECGVDIKTERKKMMAIVAQQAELWKQSGNKLKSIDDEDISIVSQRQTPSVELMEASDSTASSSVITIH